MIGALAASAEPGAGGPLRRWSYAGRPARPGPLAYSPRGRRRGGRRRLATVAAPRALGRGLPPTRPLGALLCGLGRNSVGASRPLSPRRRAARGGGVLHVAGRLRRQRDGLCARASSRALSGATIPKAFSAGTPSRSGSGASLARADRSRGLAWRRRAPEGHARGTRRAALVGARAVKSAATPTAASARRRAGREPAAAGAAVDVDSHGRPSGARRLCAGASRRWSSWPR